MSFIYGPECECGHATTATITGYGPDDAQVVAVGIAPGRQEIREGRPFMGPAGKRFNDVLKASGFSRDQVYCTNLICWYKDAPTFEEIAACWPRLRAELEARRPKLILALGALASEWLTGYKVGKVRGGLISGEDLAPPARLWEYGHKVVYPYRTLSDHHIPEKMYVSHETIIAAQVQAKLHGEGSSFIEAFGNATGLGLLPAVNKIHPDLHVMSTWHPAATLGGRNPALVGDLVRDFKKIPRFLEGELDPIPYRMHEVLSRKEAQQILYWLSGRQAALDVETTFDTSDKWGSLLCLSISTYLPPYGNKVARRWTPEGTAFGHYHPDGCYVSYYFPREVLDDLDWPGSLRDGQQREGTHWGFHSGPFDRNVLRRELGVDLPIIWDSMYDSYSCDERPGYDRDDRAVAAASGGRNKSIGPGYHNLDQLAREYCGAGFFKDATKGWIGTDPAEWSTAGGQDKVDVAQRWASLRDRNALDAAYTMALPSRLPRGQSAPCYSTLLLPAANAYCDISRTGIRIDVERLRALEADWGRERSSMEKHLEEWAADLGYANPPKRKRDTEGEPFNPGSPQQLARLLFSPAGETGGGLGLRSKVRTPKGKPSTSEEALQEIDHPFVTELMRLRKYANTLKYLPMIREHLRPDGRVHPTFLPLVTGRYSALDPAMQTFPQPYKLEADGVPELAVLRSIIIPSDGMVLCATDYEQIEIWVAALLSQDPMMLADLREPFEGGKPNYHSNVTRNVLKCEELVGSAVWERTRRGAKVFTFGIEFGEGPDGLAKNASKEMGTKMSKPAAARIIRDWYARYSVFAEWQRNQVRLARKQGYIENPFGFVRRFPFPDDSFRNQMYNAAIQGTASQHGTIAMVELVDPMYFGLPYPYHDGKPPRIPFQLSGCAPLHQVIGGNVLLTIHDEILYEVPEDRVEAGVAHVEQVMSHPRVPGWPGMQVSSKIGTDWFSMKSWGH